MSDHSQDNFERLQNLNVSQFLEKLSSFFFPIFFISGTTLILKGLIISLPNNLWGFANCVASAGENCRVHCLSIINKLTYILEGNLELMSIPKSVFFARELF